jgi:DUF3072 family protein
MLARMLMWLILSQSKNWNWLFELARNGLSQGTTGHQEVLEGRTFYERMAAMAQRQKRQSTSNPKLDPNPQANMEKEPDEWVSGDDPMTGAQASYLKTLCEQAGEPEAFDESLTKAEASKRIDELKQELGLQ